MNSSPDIYEYRDYLKKRYGQVLYRVPLDAGFTCPHRQNSEGNSLGGCTFCPEDGARAVQLRGVKDIRQQVEAGVRFAKRRYHAQKFMAYFQAFTNTLGSPTTLQTLVDTICSVQEFRAIAFGTRPDCLSDKVIEFLSELQRRLDVWVELGVQTSNDQTLKRINRGHTWSASVSAIERLHKAKISVGVHQIIGLPGETVDDFLDTTKKLASLPVDAVKLHNLHIIKNTVLAKQFKEQPFAVFNEHEYAEILLQLLPHIPDNRPIIRLTTDTPDDRLLAPHWSMSKGQFRKFFGKLLRNHGVSQGMALRNKRETSETLAIKTMGANPKEPAVTDDGSITFYNSQVKEHYHTLAGARSEAEYKYCRPAELRKKLKAGPLRILDVCFGLGYNSLVSCEHALAVNGSLEIVGLELDRRVVAEASAILTEPETFFSWNHCLQTILEKGTWSKGNCSISIVWGDARHTARKVTAPFDLIWLDAFSTQKNCELWTIDFFNALLPLLSECGALYTYCAAIPVRAGLQKAGFHIGETPAFGRDRGGTVAARSKEIIERDLPERDLFLMDTIKGIPYRDPNGTCSNKEILRNREFEILRYKSKNEQNTSNTS